MENEPSPESSSDQTMEQIRSALESAIERQFKVQLTVLDLDGQGERTEVVEPMDIEGDIVWVASDQAVMPVDLARIKRVEL